jgi:hypothetical protein
VEKRLHSLPWLAPHINKAAKPEEVLDHPLLTLLAQVNPVHNTFDLWELTQMYLEVRARGIEPMATKPRSKEKDGP